MGTFCASFLLYVLLLLLHVEDLQLGVTWHKAMILPCRPRPFAQLVPRLNHPEDILLRRVDTVELLCVDHLPRIAGQAAVGPPPALATATA